VALKLCAQPLELLARRDIKRLQQLCGERTPPSAPRWPDRAARAQARAPLRRRRAQHHRARRHRHQGRRGAQVRFRVQLNPTSCRACACTTSMPARCAAQGRGPCRAAAAAAGGALVHQEHPAALRHHPARLRAIVERQKNFFVHGELAMRPLVLREIADELGLHESTISRVTTAKYMATPRAPSS
jgi:RNA polymerase sigma-54 factor